MRTTIRTFGALIVILALALIPGTVWAESPAEQLAALAKHVETALARLDQGDLAGARAAYQAFDDGWFTIEDGIRAQSRDHYRAIEDAMDDVRYALRAEPFDAARAHEALEHLRAACNAFISGAPPSTTASTSSSATGPVTLGTLIGHLDRAQAAIDAGDFASAAAAMDTFRRDWTEVEGLVKAKSAQVYADTERNMAQAYALLTQRAPDGAAASAVIRQLKADLAPFASGETRYGWFDAAVILLREGFEALLVVAALLAFLKKTDNADKCRWIWAGGGAGVLVSVLAAIGINLIFARATAGTNRELVEGITGLVAAVMLVYVSYWLHSKASLSAWQRYIRDKSTAALARNSLLSLALIAFLAVFREGAETVLFYIGIAPSIALSDLLLGLGVGASGLALLAVLVLVFGVRVPIRPFFLGTSILIYYLAFKFVGTGIHALQVAGILGATPAAYLPESGFFGLFPTWETTAAQAILLVAAAIAVVIIRIRESTSLREEHQVSVTG